jgi:hypothetical protein
VKEELERLNTMPQPAGMSAAAQASGTGKELESAKVPTWSHAQICGVSHRKHHISLKSEEPVVCDERAE